MSEETCPTCGSAVRIIGNTTKSYEPIDNSIPSKDDLLLANMQVKASDRIVVYNWIASRVSAPTVCANCDGQGWVCEDHADVPLTITVLR